MYAVIDIGSNTIRMVLYKVEQGQIKQMLNKKQMAGLAGYINKKRKMTAEGIDKAVEVLTEFRQALDNITVEEVFVFATASLRNIENTGEVVEEIRRKCGFTVQVLTGTEEAVFDYYGAVQSVPVNDGLLIDTGGGSTELVFYIDKEVVSTQSIPIGSLNMYTKYVANIIPTHEELQSIREETLAALNKIVLPDVPLFSETVCGVGGTLRASYKLYQELYSYYPQGQYTVEGLKALLEHADDKRLIHLILKICPERIHTIFPGLVILETIMDRYQSKQITVSPYGVREGYLYYQLQERGIM